MTRTSLRAPRKPKAARDAQQKPALVFRDFVRQLEKLGQRPAKPSQGEAR